jgi:hypothetical protein
VRAAPLGLALAMVLGTGTGAGGQAARPALRFATADSSRPTPQAPLVALLSAALPGAGEYVLHLDRWMPLVAGEAFAWWQYRAHRQDGRSFERRYRKLACDVARVRFVPGTCRDTSDFEYYESLGKPRYNSSGAWDVDPDPNSFQPETDTTTYNGHVWQRANQLEPGSSLALDYYRKYAIPEAFRWNWGGNTLEQTYYDELIRRGDDSFRTSSRILGLILANHLASAVDAFIAGRLRELARTPRIEVRSGFEPGGESVRWRAGVVITPPRR